MGDSPLAGAAASIRILNDDSLLNIFYLYRPAIFDGDGDDILEECIMKGNICDREKWWHKLAHVCQRWRNLILGSASYLGLCLVCKTGTPVADILAHSPHLPLIICYDDKDCDVTVEDEEGIFLALEQRDRVRCIRLLIPTLMMQKLLSLMAVHVEYPILEYMVVGSLTEDRALMLPEVLQAPRLRHLALIDFAFPTGCRLLTTAVGLVTLYLCLNHPSIDFQPTVLFQWLSLMPQLEILVIEFSDRDVERQLIHEPITTHVTLPNLRWLRFHYVGASLESLIRRIAAPSLKYLIILFGEQRTFSVPYQLQFLNTTIDLEFSHAEFGFLNEGVSVDLKPREKAETYTLSICIYCQHFDWQVSSMVQICDLLSHLFSTVEHLTLEYMVHEQSSKEHNEVDRTEWRNLLRSFGKVKTLRIDHGLVGEISRILRPDGEELPLELLPELQELTITLSDDVRDTLTSFIDARQNTGHTVTLSHSLGIPESSSSRTLPPR